MAKWALRAFLAVALLSCALLPASAEEVLELTTENFDDALQKHPFLVVEFFAPWCGHCKKLAPEWEKAAVALKGDTSAGVPITLASVDATIHKPLGERFSVQGFPTIHVFENGEEKPSEFEGPRDANGIVGYLKKRAGPASKEVTTADEAKKLVADERMIMLLAGAETEGWKKISAAMRDACKWVHSADKAVWKEFGAKAGSVSVIRNFDEKMVAFSGKESETDALKAFVLENRRPVAMPVKKGDQETLKILFEDDSMPNLFMFTAAGAGKEVDFFKTVAKANHKEMVSGIFSATDFPESFDHFGMSKTAADLPKLLIEDRKSGLRFRMDGDVTPATIEKFVADHKAGALEPFLKSEDAPADNSAPVKVIVGNTFESLVSKAGKWVLLEAYAPWCGHCKNLIPVWEDLGKAFAGSSDKVTIAKIDATANDIPKALGVTGFPTLMLFQGDGSPPERYATGDRDYASLAAWVTKKTGVAPAADYKPTSPKAPAGGSAGAKTLGKKIIAFLSTEFEVPLLPTHAISGLWIAAVIIFLLFIAAIALVVAFVAKDPAAAAAPKAAANTAPKAAKKD